MAQYRLTQHAEDVLKERNISREWVKRVIDEPEKVERDRTDTKLEHRLGRISEYGNRVLRVVVNKTSKPLTVVTMFFDRKMKGVL